MSDCIFCQIVRGELPAQVHYEDERFLAFSPLDLVSKEHLLLIPKAHFADVFDIDEDTIGELFSTAKKITFDLVKELGATGVNFLHASGKDAQQSVFHFHLHIVPRYSQDNLDLWIRNKL